MDNQNSAALSFNIIAKFRAGQGPQSTVDEAVIIDAIKSCSIDDMKTFINSREFNDTEPTTFDICKTFIKKKFENWIKVEGNLEKIEKLLKSLIEKSEMSVTIEMDVDEENVANLHEHPTCSSKTGEILSKSYHSLTKLSENSKVIQKSTSYKISNEKLSETLAQIRQNCDQKCMKSSENQVNLVKGEYFQQFLHIFECFALKELYPEKDEICGIKCDSLVVEFLKNFELLTMKNGKIAFVNQKLGSYLAAEFILDNIKSYKWELYDNFAEVFVDILVIEKHGEIRKFLDENLKTSFFGCRKEKMQNFAAKVIENIKRLSETTNLYRSSQSTSLSHGQFKKLSFIFEENLGNLIDFLIEIFKHADYKDGTNIIVHITRSSLFATDDANTFKKFMNFATEHLASEELMKIFIENVFMEKFLKSSLFADTVEDMLSKIKRKPDVQKILKLKNPENANLLVTAGDNLHFDSKNFDALFEVFVKYLPRNDILEMVADAHKFSLHVWMFQENYELILTSLFENYLKTFSGIKLCKLMRVKLPMYGNGTILHLSALVNKERFQQVLWQFLPKIFPKSNDLKKYIEFKDKYSNNFLHTLVSYNCPKVIKFVFITLQKHLSPKHYKIVLSSKGFRERNLLQKAADKNKIVGSHKVLWDIVRDVCGNDGFKEYLSYKDRFGNTVLHCAATYLNGKVFEFMIDEIRKNSSREEIRDLLQIENSKYNENLLQSAVKINKNIDVHMALWKIFKEFFNTSELKTFVSHKQIDDANLMHIAVGFSNKQIAVLTWDEIKNFMNYDEQKKYLECIGFRDMSLKENCEFKSKYQDVKNWLDNIWDEYFQDS